MSKKETPLKEKPLELTKIEDFKEEAEIRSGQLLKLPSGKVVKVGKPRLSDLIESGSIPGDLINFALGERDIADGKNKERDAALDEKNQKLGLRLMKHIVLAAVIEPKVVLKDPDYSKGEVPISVFSDSDRMEIYSFALGGIDDLKSFRSERFGDLSEQSSESVSGEQTESVDGDQK